jgi:GAF domain-containing protein
MTLNDVGQDVSTTSVPSVCVKIAEFTHALHGAVGSDPTAVWARITSAAPSYLADVDHASITVIDNRETVHSRASTDRQAAAADDIQQCYLQGPGIEAARGHETQRIDNIGSENRWPTFVANASAATPIRSIITFPLYANETTSGALNLFADQPDVFSGESGLLAEVFAHNAAVIVEAAHRERQLHHLLTNRDIIGQAKGVLMERYAIDAVAAFALMAQLSSQRGQSVPAVARRLLRKKH